VESRAARPCAFAIVLFPTERFIEVSSGSALLWRMSMDADAHRREAVERQTLRIVGMSFLLLATYVAVEAIRDLIGQQAPARSLAGILLACASLVLMPLLSRARALFDRQRIAGLVLVNLVPQELVNGVGCVRVRCRNLHPRSARQLFVRERQ